MILDIACGAGVVTARMMEKGGRDAKDVSVVCGDLDQTMVDMVADRIQENGWPAKAERLDAQVIKTLFTIPIDWGPKRQIADRRPGMKGSRLQRFPLYPRAHEFWASADARSCQSPDRQVNLAARSHRLLTGTRKQRPTVCCAPEAA